MNCRELHREKHIHLGNVHSLLSRHKSLTCWFCPEVEKNCTAGWLSRCGVVAEGLGELPTGGPLFGPSFLLCETVRLLRFICVNHMAHSNKDRPNMTDVIIYALQLKGKVGSWQKQHVCKEVISESWYNYIKAPFKKSPKLSEEEKETCSPGQNAEFFSSFSSNRTCCICPSSLHATTQH